MYSSNLPVYSRTRRDQGWVSVGLLLIAGAVYFIAEGAAMSDPLEFAATSPPAVLGAVLIFSRNGRVATALSAVAIACVGYWMFVRTVDAGRLRPIAEAATGVVDAQRVGTGQFSVPGKVLVWDVNNDCVSSVHYRLPAPLRARSCDPAMTIFLIWDTQSKKVGTYHKLDGSRAPVADAFIDGSNVAVVTWPGRRLLGWHAAVSAAPPQQRVVKVSEQNLPVHGDWIRPLVAWIQSLRTPTSPSIWPDSSAWLGMLLPASPVAPAGSVRTAIASTTAATQGWTEATARAEAIRRYPEIAVANSALNRAFVQKYEELKASNPAFLRDPMWPLRLAEEVAR
jgi:hypothetical protein